MLSVVGDTRTLYVNEYFEVTMENDVKVNLDLTIEPVDICENRYCVFIPLAISDIEALGMSSGNFGTGTLIPQGMQPDNANVTWRVYYPGGGLRVQTSTADSLSYLVQDHLNSTSLTLNSTGSLTGEMIYSAFGETRYSFGATPTDRLYTGQYEAEAGLYFYNARWYDNQLGRFAQADSIIPEPGNPMAWDRYAYVNNNPVIYNDPSGHSVDCGIGDYYCGNLQRELTNSDWQKHLPFNKFMLGKEANEYYYKNEERAFQDSYVGGEKESIMWARIYSEDVLHRSFEPISDFMVLDKIEQARDTKDIELFYRLSSGFALLEYMAADKGFGSSRGSTGRTEPNNLYEQLAMEAAKADPLSGRILRINMTDSRWLAEEGWIKMSQRINGIEIHYVYNKELGLFDDFKFR